MPVNNTVDYNTKILLYNNKEKISTNHCYSETDKAKSKTRFAL